MRLTTLFPCTALTLLLTLATASLHAQETAAPERVRIDVKTKLLEKLALTAAKNGAVLLIEESDWGETAELDEDYALWLRNLERTESGDSVHVRLDLELREASLLGEGDLLSARTIAVAWPRALHWSEQAPPSTAELIGDIERYAGYGLDAVRIVASPLTSFAIARALELAEGELPGGSLDAAKLEAMIVGARIAFEARSMVEAVGE